MSASIADKIFLGLLIVLLAVFNLGGLNGQTASAAEPKKAPEEKKAAEKHGEKPAELKAKEAEKKGGHAPAEPKAKEAEKKGGHAPAEPEAKDGEKKEDKSSDPQEAAPKAEKPKLPDRASTLSPEMFQMMEMIEKKNQELKKKEEELQLKEQTVKTLEQQVRSDLDKIQQAMTKSQEQFGMRDGLIEKNINALVKVYSTMKAAEAAAVLGNMDEELAVLIISRMKSKIAGQVLSKLGGKAKSISEKLAGKDSAKILNQKAEAEKEKAKTP